MALIVNSGIRINPGIKFSLPIGILGSTLSTTTPTVASGVTVGVSGNGSPFSTTANSYNWTAAGFVPPQYYFSVPGGSGFAMGTGDYTVEWFQYQTDTNSFPRYFWYGTSPSWGMSIEGGTYIPYVWGAGSAYSLGSTTNNRNSWIHYALVRISGTVKLYRNGVQNGNSANITTNITDTTSTMYFGNKAGSGLASEAFGGSMTSIRICKGIGVYTGNFTVPTTKLAQTQDANPYGGANTSAITSGQCSLLLNP